MSALEKIRERIRIHHETKEPLEIHPIPLGRGHSEFPNNRPHTLGERLGIKLQKGNAGINRIKYA